VRERERAREREREGEGERVSTFVRSRVLTSDFLQSCFTSSRGASGRRCNWTAQYWGNHVEIAYQLSSTADMTGHDCCVEHEQQRPRQGRTGRAGGPRPGVCRGACRGVGSGIGNCGRATDAVAHIERRNPGDPDPRNSHDPDLRPRTRRDWTTGRSWRRTKPRDSRRSPRAEKPRRW
jgi:hypothetical protein